MPKSTETQSERPKDVIDEPPPFLGAWPRVYVVVLCWLAIVIFLFWIFSRAFLP